MKGEKSMVENNIRKAWYEMEKLFGPNYYGRDTALKNVAQTYSNSILDACDKERIKQIGKKHLKLVAEKMLDGEQFSTFLNHVICYERFLK